MRRARAFRSRSPKGCRRRPSTSVRQQRHTTPPPRAATTHAKKIPDDGRAAAGGGLREFENQELTTQSSFDGGKCLHWCPTLARPAGRDRMLWSETSPIVGWVRKVSETTGEYTAVLKTHTYDCGEKYRRLCAGPHCCESPERTLPWTPLAPPPHISSSNSH